MFSCEYCEQLWIFKNSFFIKYVQWLPLILLSEIAFPMISYTFIGLVCWIISVFVNAVLLKVLCRVLSYLETRIYSKRYESIDHFLNWVKTLNMGICSTQLKACHPFRLSTRSYFLANVSNLARIETGQRWKNPGLPLDLENLKNLE